jgi:tRNA(Ile)-lysidine synthase
VLLARVRRTVAERRLLRPGDRVVVACSGGPDSVALVDVLGRLSSELGLTLVVASVDHGLRPEAAAEVERVGALAARLRLPFRALRVTVGGGRSLQAAARDARYGALHELAAREKASRIAVGHTEDDQAETVLARLLRGASVDGIAGIAPRRRDGVIRPLLDARRADVLAHLAHAGLDFSDDPSNRDARFFRSRIRHALLPALEAEDSRVVEHLARLADDARATRRVVRREAKRLLRAAARGEGALAVDLLRAAEPAIRRAALRAFLSSVTGKSPSRRHVEAVDHALSGRGEVRIGAGLAARVEGGALLVGSPTSARTRSGESATKAQDH